MINPMNRYLAAGYLIGFFSIVGCEKQAPATSVSETYQDAPIERVATELPEQFSKYKPLFESSEAQYVSIAVEPTLNTSFTQSKLRGKPYWPKSMDYPKDIDGQPLQLLAQINFQEVPEGLGLPSSGILQFFIHPGISKDQVWGMSFYQSEPFVPNDFFNTMLQQDYFRVVYHENDLVDENLLRNNFPSPGDNIMPVLGEASLGFSLDKEMVGPEDYQFEEKIGVSVQDFYLENKDLPYEIFDDLSAFIMSSSPMKMGGYGRFVQGDPRTSAENPSDWMVLLNFESFQIGKVDSMWGDGGTATFFIEKHRLAEKDFSKVAYYWDNH